MRLEIEGLVASPAPEFGSQVRSEETTDEQYSTVVDAYFGPTIGWRPTTCIRNRRHVPERGINGPAIVFDYDTTVVVPPAWRVKRGRLEALVLQKGESA
jgi:N-methylhydantoinase A/oxoprolinase/acetone carboxylase beta subunit